MNAGTKLSAVTIDVVNRDGKRIASTGRLIEIARPGSDVPAVALRTELDALPVVERSGVPWASTVTPVPLR